MVLKLETQNFDFTWKADLHNLHHGVAKFLINSVINILPTKDNLILLGGRNLYLSHVPGVGIVKTSLMYCWVALWL